MSGRGEFDQWQDRLGRRRTDFVDVLPDELWVKIFKNSMADGPAQVAKTSYALRSFRRVTNPFLLNSVCKEWRRICKAHAEVWDTVFMAFAWMDGETKEMIKAFKQRVNALGLWMLRAGTRTISLTYRIIETDYFPFDNSNAMGLPRIVAYHARRIKYLDCVVSSTWYNIFKRVPFPVLEKLKFICGDYAEHIAGDGGYPFGHDYCRWTQDSVLDLAGSCSKLTTVWLEASFSSIGLMLPWDQIVDIEVGHVERALAIEILERLPNLRRCKMAMAPYVTDDDWMQSPDNHGRFEGRGRVTATALETLALRTLAPSAFGDILGIAPLSLKGIDVHNFNEPPLDEGLVLDPLLPFASTLETLSIGFCSPLDTDQLVAALSQLNAIVSLTIAFGDQAEPLDDGFMRSVLTTPGVLPRLQRVFVATSDLWIGDDALLKFLRYRGHANANGDSVSCERIREVRLGLMEGAVAPRLQLETVAELGRMVANGLQFRIEHVTGQLERVEE